MKLTSNVTAFIVGALALIGALVLTGLHDTVPGYVWAIAIAGVTAGAGLSVPGGVPAAASLADAVPALITSLNKAFPGVVKVEDVAAEVLRQVVASNTVPVPIAVPTVAQVLVSPSAAAVTASVAPFVPPATP